MPDTKGDASPPFTPPSGGDYDLLPYISMPLAYSHPSRLAGIAALQGYEGAATTRARVLEIGCASGGNIIPLALQFPDARITGIDIAKAHIDDGNRRIAALGLRNIALRHADISKAAFAGEAFDTIICHGVYSWVPPVVQDAILSACRDTLSPDGLAVISYNVLPGWHLRSVIRDILLHHAGHEGPPRARVKQAREALDALAVNASATDPYGQVLRREAKRLALQPSSYILGEFLMTDNAPCTLTAFIRRARDHGLDYLCDANAVTAASELLDGAMTTQERIAAEQRTDMVTGRTFRRSILVRSGRTATLGPGALERLRPLHIVAALAADPASGGEGIVAVKDARGRPVKAREAAAGAALTRLAATFPATSTLDELAAAVDGRRASDADRHRIARVVLRLIASARATVTTTPLRVGRADVARPVAFPLARLEAASGQPWITSRRHDGVALNPAVAALVPLLDGSRDRDALAQCLVAEMRDGTLKGVASPASSSDADLGTAARDLAERTLAYLAINGVLEPEPQRQA